MKESLIVTAIGHYLQLMENQRKLVFQRNNTGAMPVYHGDKRSFMRFGKRGAPDFLVFVKGGRVIHLEIKSEKGRISVSQLEYENKVKNLGHKYFVVRSVDEAQIIINDFI